MSEIERMSNEPQTGFAEVSSILQSVLTTAVDAIITIDSRGIIRHANPAACQMFGFGLAELLGQNISCLMPSPYREEHDGYMENYLRTGVAKIIGIGREVTARRKDGSVFPIELAVSESPVGTQRLFTGIIRDTTDRKTAEDRLVQSQRLAAIGQMVTGLAHESRNALQRSRAYLDMLELDLHDVEQLQLVSDTKHALQELQRLYEEVRNYAAPIRLDLGRCNLAAVCESVWKQVVVAESRAGMTLQLSDQSSVESLQCDEARLRQVLRNVFENAVAVSPREGQILAHIQNCHFRGLPALRLSIRDEGPGLTPDQLPLIFEPFYTTKTKGTGLGLAICRRILDAHGGSISAELTTGGAEFIVILPVTPAKAVGAAD